MSRVLFIITIWLLVWLPRTEAAPVRLAIIPQAESLRAPADLLAVAFSTNNQVELLERAQLNKVLQEQALVAATSKDFVRLGELLGADGLLLIDEAEDDRPQLVATLLAVKPGVVLRRTAYDLPAVEPARWADLVARQVSELFPKLGVLLKDAVPLSILNLRASVDSLQARALEQELSRLLYDRLIREREVFVLDRRSLQSLAAEKELKGPANEAFWNGGYLLEGIINKEGFSAGKVTISGRLVPPERKNFIPIELSGASTNLSSLINDLAARILSTLKREGATAEWNALAEAERYFEEAKWAYRWGMFSEARAASDASWALGQQTADVAELRINAYRECAGDPGFCIIDAMAKRVRFGRTFTPGLINNSEMAAFDLSADPERLTDFVRTLEMYENGLRTFVGLKTNLPPNWFVLGRDLLDRAGWWLRYYYFTIEARKGREESITDLRRLALEIEAALAAHPSLAERDPNHTLLGVKARHVAFWVDAPDQALAVYRQMVTSGHWALVRTRFLNAAYAEEQYGMSFLTFPGAGERADPASPCLAGWSWTDRKRCPAIWTDFIDELSRSTNPLVQVEGRILRCSYAWSQEDYENNLQQLLDFIWENREVIAAANMDAKLLVDIGKLQDAPMSTLSPAGRTRLSAKAWDKFQRDFSEFRKQHELASSSGNPNQGTVGAGLPRPAITIPPPGILPGKPPEQKAAVSANILEASRFWAIPSDPARSKREILPHVTDCCYRDGRLWVEVRYTEVNHDLADFFAMDLDTLKWEVVRFADAIVPNTEAYPGPTERLFDVYNGSLYLCLFENVMRYDLARRTWSAFQLPVAGRSHPHRLDERIFFATDSSILEYTSDGGFRVLASTRRRPAATVLDSLDNLGVPNLFITPNREVRARVRGEIYSLSQDAKEWRRLTSVPEDRLCTALEEGIFSRVGWGGDEDELWVLRGNDPAFELLFRQFPRPERRSMAPAWPPMTNVPAWEPPQGIQISKSRACIQKDCIWFLMSPPEVPTENATAGLSQEWQTLILRFKPGEDLPLQIPVRFTSGASAPPSVRGVLGSKNRLGFHSTPQGFIVSRGFLPGFWFIPTADLAPFINAHDSQRQAEQDALKLDRAGLGKELLMAFGKNGERDVEALDKEAMISDRRYLELELPNIDTNHNGLLDLAELGFFDANTNHLLEDAEQTGIQITLTNLAEKLLAKLDRNQNGRLEADEIPAHFLAPMAGPWTSVSLFEPGYASTDRTLGKEGIVSAMQRKLMMELRRRIGAATPPPDPGRKITTSFHEVFKSQLERFWRQDQAPGNTTLTNQTAAPKVSAPSPSKSQAP